MFLGLLSLRVPLLFFLVINVPLAVLTLMERVLDDVFNGGSQNSQRIFFVFLLLLINDGIFLDFSSLLGFFLHNCLYITLSLTLFVEKRCLLLANLNYLIG